MYINAVGIEYPDMEELNKQLLLEILGGKRICIEHQLDISNCENSREYRRFDRFSIIAMQGIKKIMKAVDGQDIVKGYDMATVFNTSFGPIKTNLDFIHTIYEKDGTVPSPITFSHTVNNAALGHVCKNQKFKGPSTLLLSSNGIGVAESILKNKSAKEVLVIGAEQYCDELQMSYRQRGIQVVEAVAVILGSLEKSENTYCRFLNYSEGNLGCHPIYGRQITRLDFIEKLTEKAIQRSQVSSADIQYAVINSFDDSITQTQTEYYKKLNPDIQVINLYDSLGEMLGADFNVGATVIAKLYQENMIEEGKCCILHSFDISGNYITYVLNGA